MRGELIGFAGLMSARGAICADLDGVFGANDGARNVVVGVELG